jgi:hypothetical protein
LGWPKPWKRFITFSPKPGGEAAHFRAVERVDAEQQLFAINLVEKFGDGAGIRQHGAVRLDQHRNLAGRVEGEEFGPPLPALLHLQGEIEGFLLQHETDLAGEGRKPEMIKQAHGATISEQPVRVEGL